MESTVGRVIVKWKNEEKWGQTELTQASSDTILRACMIMPCLAYIFLFVSRMVN